MTESCRHIVFRGRVQGVGFRFTTSRIAANHDVSGWVKNQADGTVELVAAGPARAVQTFIDDVRETMSGYISSVDESPCPGHDTPRSFEIRR